MIPMGNNFLTKEPIMAERELKMVKTERKPRNVPEHINKLDMVKSHKVTTLIMEHFTEKRMGYRDFAEWATAELGFPVSETHIMTRVNSFEIPHGDKPTPPDPSEFTAMLLKHETQVAELTERMLKMEAWVNNTFPSVSGKKMLQG
jgi:hypothetical protein